MKMRIIGLLFVGLLAVSCISTRPVTDSKITVLPLGDTIQVTEGSLVYALPMTLFEISVELERSVEKPGPYARYASEMIGIKDVITGESESWSIAGVKVRSFEEIDPSEFYIIESNTLLQSNALELKRSGLILDVNPDIYEQDRGMGQTDNGDFSQLEFIDLGADEYFISHNDTAFRLVKLDTAFIQIPYLVERKRALTLEQLADKAAKTLLELREGKHYILTGEANVFPQTGAAINEMNRLEAEYTALFAGKTLKDKKIIRYTFIPQREMAGTQPVLFRFSDITGPADAGGKTGTPVVIELIPARKTKDITFVLRPKAVAEQMQTYDKLFYRIPDVVTVNIKRGNETLYNARKLIYQFGEVVQLPANYIIGK